MAHEPDIFGYLATTQISGITSALLDSSTKNTYANRSNVQFWKGPITLFRVLESSRTYPHGLAIPEDSKVAATADATSASLQPSGTEVFNIQAISFQNNSVGAATITLKLDSGAGTAEFATLTAAGGGGTVAATLQFPLQVTNSVFFSWSSDENVISFTAYNVVSR
jgi:hypothetical protein